ncbi:retrovirus-related pol polyprotein from transposon TNT 1-94 [Tanacetum coccineum]|uniref:Retrovirus-related pol polyprotein from transposon TNT 1-94 n=1 Tax=Tanacetum coccineum TaxID=301880 RepID=A0ABQ5GKH2_9ASTR
MSSNSDDIQAAGSDTRPPMLDRTDYEAWSQRIRLDTLGTTPEGGVLLGPERPRTYEDLSDTEKKRYDADVCATNIVLQGLPKDIYKLINHNIKAKAIWDNVKMRTCKLVNDMRNIIMTMSNIQLNFKFVNNMSPEWDRFVTAVKLNKGLKETNHEQLYAYLKQHEKHVAQDRLIIERITPATNDQLAFVSTVQPHAQSSHVQSHQYPSSSTNPQSLQYPQFPETSQIDSGYTQTDEILDNLTKQMTLLAQSFRATLPQMNNQLRASSNTRNQATIQDGRVVVQNVQGRQNQNQNQRYVARGNWCLHGALPNGEAHNIAGNAKADECDAFDSDVDDEPTAQTIFMANLSSVGSANPQAGPSNASILSEVHTLENVIDHSITNQDEHEIHNEVQYCASSTLNNVCVSSDNDAFVPHDPIANELKIYKEQVAIYEQRAKFELTEREQRMDDQMRMLIQNRNKTEENLKKELHSVKLQLNSTMENNKIIEGTVTTLKQELKQKESKFLTDFSNLKHLNDKLENKLHSQDQSIQTVHMMLNPTQVYDQKTKTALELELAEATRNKLHVKMNDSACVEKRVNIIPPNYSKENFLATFTPQTQLTPEQVFWSIDLEKRKAEELKANTPPLPVLPPATVYPPNTPVHLVPRTLPTTSQVNIGLYVITQLFWDFEKTCKKRITPTGITEGERGFEQTKRCYLTEVIPFFNLLKEHFDSVQKSLVTEVRAMKAVFENMEAEVDQNAVDKKCGEIERRNLLIMNENLIAECLSKDVFYTATDSVLNVSRFSDMHDALTIAQNRIADLESENFNLRNKIQNDDHDSMIKHFSKLEVEHFNLQLKYQNLKERFGNKKPVTSSDDPSFDSLFVIGQLNEQIQSRGNTIRELKEKISRLTMKNSDADPIFDPKALVSQNKDLTAKLNALHDLNERFRAENAKVKQHYKELYDSIKITRAKTNDQKNSLLTEIENLKTQLKGKMPCVTIDVKTPKVSAFEKYAIDVEPIPPRQRSNRNVHHGYLNSLKDTLDTLREIVEEARSELPSDSNLDYACVYTKRSQELLANASASCPKAVNKRDKFIATTPVTKKKRVTFADPLETSGNNTPKHVKQQSVQPTNVPILPSTGVNTATIASGSKPRSNTKKDKTLPAKSVPKKKVEDHPRNNKSKLSKKNRVDSCTSVRSTVFDTNSNSLCKTCNECINSISHDKCVDKFLKSSKTTMVRKMWRVKHVKQTWQPMGKLFTTVGHHWKPTGRTLPLGAQCPLTRKTTPKIVLVKIWNPTGRLIPLRGQCPLTRPTALISDIVLADPQAHHAPMEYNIVVQIVLWYLDSGCSKHMIRDRSWLKNFMKKFIGTIRFRNDHFGAIMGYGDYVISDSSINGKKYILVIVDDYSRFTWVKFLRSKDETPAFIIKLLKQLQVGLNKTVRFVQTDNGTEFAEAVATVCYTQNRSLIHTLHNKTPYELVHDQGFADSEVQVKNGDEIPRSSGVNSQPHTHT